MSLLRMIKKPSSRTKDRRELGYNQTNLVYWAPVAIQWSVLVPAVPATPTVIPEVLTAFAYATFVGVDGPTSDVTTEYTAPNERGNVIAEVVPADMDTLPHCISNPLGKLAKPF